MRLVRPLGRTGEQQTGIDLQRIRTQTLIEATQALLYPSLARRTVERFDIARRALKRYDNTPRIQILEFGRSLGLSGEYLATFGAVFGQRVRCYSDQDSDEAKRIEQQLWSNIQRDAGETRNPDRMTDLIHFAANIASGAVDVVQQVKIRRRPDSDLDAMSELHSYIWAENGRGQQILRAIAITPTP